MKIMQSIVKDAENWNKVMESESISKNAARTKSHTSRIISLILLFAVFAANSNAQIISGSFGMGVATHRIKNLSDNDKYFGFLRFGLHGNISINEKLAIQPGLSYFKTNYQIMQFQIKTKYNLMDWLFLQAEPNINLGSPIYPQKGRFAKVGFGLGAGVQTKGGFQFSYEYGFINKIPYQNIIKGNLSSHMLSFTFYDKSLLTACAIGGGVIGGVIIAKYMVDFVATIAAVAIILTPPVIIIAF